MLFDSSTISLLDYLSRGSIITFLIIVVYGGYKRWWVFGWSYSELEERNQTAIAEVTNRCEAITREKDAWRETALKSSNIATKAFDEARRQHPSIGSN